MPTHHLVSSHTPQQTLPHSLVLPVISRRFTSSLAHSHGVVLHSLLLSGFTFCFFLFPSFPSLPLSLSHAHTLAYAEKTFFPPDCFPIFLAERFMVRGMLETGYYHVLFELISQTKWSRWKRRHSLGGGPLPRHTPPTRPPLCSRPC